MLTDDLLPRIQKIKALFMDVDGVLTDGRIVLGNYGDELKFFDIQDGNGLVLMNRAGFKTAFITGKKSRINIRRAKDLKVSKVCQNAQDKLKAYEKLLRQFKLQHEDVCYIGDDLIDIPVLKRVGFAVAVENAVDEVKEAVHYKTEHKGGRGAVREVVNIILKAQGKWADVTKRYYR
jgi:3-deoxy-D-manno-octulosonate 8-phosphate phosphatase (KDO 8-P phosphatase)